jgi:hypothetical protein
LERVVSWEWDPSADRIVASAALPLVYGVPAIEHVSRGFTLVHPDDTERHESLVHAAVDRGRGYQSSFRIIRPDTHAIVWIEERAEAIGRGSLEPPQLIGLSFDASRRHAPRTARWIPDALDALEEFGDVLLGVHASRRRHAPRSQQIVLGAWVAAATREFARITTKASSTGRAAADSIRVATAALRQRNTRR